MSQRAALLRTLMAGGDFWLLDEPFAKLDALTREEMQSWLLGIIQRFQPGVLLITHDIEEAIKLADQIPVSYTHLDVYKRQPVSLSSSVG